jgi:hypothetical protein
MDEQPKHTPGPFEMRPVMGEDSVEIYSSATGESVARVHSPSRAREGSPSHETALHNAVLFKAAPRLREALQGILDSKHENIRSSTARGMRSLLAEIDAGPTEAFLKERDEQRRETDELLQAQADEMALQTDGKPDEEDEEHGPSFGF